MDIKDLLNQEIDLKKTSSVPLEFYFKKYLRHWYLFLAGVLLLCGAALAYIYYTPSQYEINSTLMINNNTEAKKGFSNNTVLDDLDGYQTTSNVENEVEVLTSVSLIKKALENLDLYNTFFVADGFKRYKEIYGIEVPVSISYSKINDRPKKLTNMVGLEIIDDQSFELEMEEGFKSRHNFGDEISNFFGEFTIHLKENQQEFYPKSLFFTYNDMREMAFEYRENINAEPTNKLSTVISLKFLATIPEKGEDFLKTLVEVYNTEALKNINSTASNTLAFIDEQMEKLTTELAEIEKAVETYKNENSISDLSAESQIYLQNSNTTKQKLSEYDINFEVLNNLEENLTSSNNLSEMVQGSLLIEDDALSDLVKKYNELQRQRQRLLNGTTSDNPLVKNLDEQLFSLRSNLLENIQSSKKSLQVAKKSLQENALAIEERANRVPQIERELLNITRQQSIKQENYQYLMKKREESILSLAATSVSNARVIDPPIAGLYPARPMKKLIMVFAFILGLGIPFGLIFVKDYYFGKIGQKNEVEAMSQVPIMGEISHEKRKNLYLGTPHHKSLIGEQINLIWTNMKFASMKKTNQVILTTSSIGGEGKTFFSINLARTIGLSGKKTVILEFDLRKPSVLKQLGIKTNKPGISEYLSSENYITSDILTLSEENPNIFLIGAGKLPDNPLQIMNSPRLEGLFVELRSKFDHIIIDSAPIGLVADAFYLSAFADMVAYVVRYYYTKPNHLKLINEIAQNEKFPNPVLVLNDAKSEHSYGYKYGYYYDLKSAKI
ncbi:polysaccharide biosynthesis tyrosine autokinase [Cyclobacterium sp.]|uniref:GumC family protein n=1 Tax=Cyclobacterium sp. TaxID=1966343 RepID=UPI00198D8C6D|nr:polysaccharide biosynthesis tyrosine autokinase [Cyclobacterium sp.]MBD3627940.1 AAA family ATPase [Cyclobacterium sp.]